jgi:hypothetical protein
MSAAVYNPVTGPTRSGVAARTTEGRSAPATAIPMPASAVPPYSATRPGTARSPAPAAMSATAPASTAASPKRRAVTAATGANRPMQSTGTVVSAPAATADRSNSAVSASTIGGTDVMTGRRLAATRMTAAYQKRDGLNPRPRRLSPR